MVVVVLLLLRSGVVIIVDALLPIIGVSGRED